MSERHRLRYSRIEYSIYEMSNAKYVNIIKVTSVPLKWTVISSLYVGSSLFLLVMAIQFDGLEIEAVFQSFSPSFDAPVLTSPSG